ncbi:MAG: hypothetical protein EZS28_035858 [Streblomastix strix]|uniref:Uncharacterized protein n=1 Tax=Streblomastix strix TaxID=222440 RepID=A0A5J4UGG1_9EUKA|nr:MAG: hypothetical protein EZS28_035858 [Streblomastix strix]
MCYNLGCKCGNVYFEMTPVNEPSLPIKRTYPDGVFSNDLIQLDHVNVIDSSINVIMISIMKSPEDVSAMSFSPSVVKLTQLKWLILVCERTGFSYLLQREQ